MIFFCSDLHFGHRNVIDFERHQFKTIEDHDNFIIRNYNKVIKENDICYILGDLSILTVANKDILIDYFKRLNGIKIIIKGNHDSASNNFYESLDGVAKVYDKPFYFSKRIVLSHEPIKCNDDVLNIHGHLHTSFLDLPNYYNVNIHLIDYTPKNLKYFQKMLGTIPKLNNDFMFEWYAKNTIFTEPHDDIYYNEDGSINLSKTQNLLIAKNEALKLENKLK